MADIVDAMTGTGLVTRADVLEHLRVSDRTLRKWLRAGIFPQPVVISQTCHRWQKQAVREWIEARRHPPEGGGNGGGGNG